jgi:hypothetical protein
MANDPPCPELGNEIKQDDSRVHNLDSSHFSKAINSTINKSATLLFEFCEKLHTTA